MADADVGYDKTNENKASKMTTDDLTRAIKKFTAERKRGPNSIQELQEAVVAELNTAVSGAELLDELEKAEKGLFVGKDQNGNYVVL